ncbi:glycosyltransferase family 92 protein [Emticicia sp. CRIBPO]|uniref:glycosyltransferase family 92 protein n=1 Tax=Emticicia sp. CRIBPO TaxID=2683258 RepID=UPI001412D59E|nr:glycosyltransferase family 92 protein [Emticicia sp. CRIBPO]MCC5648190.1 glycosyltransferase family 92 protein [Nostoc sp. CHAB 5824]NBA84258.1 glycosyltransferase family 92 protein [Emticicia sp. CRIBPO]
MIKTPSVFKSKTPKKYYLSLLSPAKNEHDYLVDFVKFYKYHGVEHFYFYDNQSTVPVKETLKDYLDCCTIIEFPGVGVQVQSYAHFMKNFKHETEWIAIFDIDEYVLPKKHETLRDFLRDYEDYDAVAINWVTFGDGHNKTQQAGPLIGNYLYSSKSQHPNFKSVYKTDSIYKVDHVHFAKLKLFSKYVDARLKPVKSVSHTEPTTDIIQLNHYFTKSEEEYLKKIKRARADTGESYYDHIKENQWLVDEHTRTNEIRTTEIWDKYKHIYEK